MCYYSCLASAYEGNENSSGDTCAATIVYWALMQKHSVMPQILPSASSREGNTEDDIAIKITHIFSLLSTAAANL